MAPKSASKAQLLAKNAELEAANRKLEEEILALRPLLRVVEAQKNTIRCQQQVISSLQKANGGVLGADRAWDFDAPEKEAPQYGDFADDPGGWAAVVAVPGGGEVELSGGAKGTTNNRMELIAAIKGLSKVPRGAKVKLVSDSQYVINGLQKGWAKSWRRNGWYKSDGKKALNPDLWKTLLELTEQRQLFYEWVRGHNGHRYNERCDRLAMQQAERLL